MPSLDELISEYENGAEADRCWIIEQLAELDDSRVLPFLLRVLADSTADPETRIAVLEDLKLRVFLDETSRAEAAATVIRVLQAEEDDDVLRSYATMSLRNFIESPHVLELLRALLLDPTEDEKLRFSALNAIEAHRERPDCRQVLEEAKRLPDVGPYVGT